MLGDRPLHDDSLVPDRIIADDAGVTLRSIAEWEKDPELGFPAAVRIRRRKYRVWGAYRKFKERRAAQSQTAGNAGYAVMRTRPRVRGRFSRLSTSGDAARPGAEKDRAQRGG